MSTDKFVRDRLTNAIKISDNTMKIGVVVQDQEQFEQYTEALRGRKGNKLVSIEIGAVPGYCRT